MPSRVFISTECTKCGGCLNLEEGTNAINCPYCSSSFLVTGYNKVLSYHIPKPLDARQTVVRSLVHRYLCTLPDHHRIQDINLFYLPFYRLTGKIFQLETQIKPGSSSFDSFNSGQVKIRTRYLERSFLATHLEGLKLYSLGVRTSVLKLNLFEKEKLQEKGKVYPVTLGIDKAMETGLGANYKDEPDYCVISKILSIVYSPLWEINILGIDTRFSIIIDALGENIIEHKAPYQFLTANFKEDNSRDFPTITFHALQCPNCGWDLTAKPEHCVFFCDKCYRAWEVKDEGFQELRGAIAHVLLQYDSYPLRYYPFWIIKTNGRYSPSKKSHQKDLKLFIPAFKVRDLTAIYKLATTFTNAQPELNLMPFSDDLPSSQMEGAVMRWDDAQELAELISLSVTSHSHTGITKDKEPAPLEISSRQLIWLPFYEKGIYLRDALLNVGIQKGKIHSSRSDPFFKT